MVEQLEATMKKIETLETLTYTKPDLGMSFHDGTYTFKVWSPLAESVSLIIYETGSIEEKTEIKTIPMTLENNVWSLSLTEDLNGLFYTYEFQHDDQMTEAPDLYSKAVGLNGDRTAIIHLEDTDRKS